MRRQICSLQKKLCRHPGTFSKTVKKTLPQTWPPMLRSLGRFRQIHDTPSHLIILQTLVLSENTIATKFQIVLFAVWESTENRSTILTLHYNYEHEHVCKETKLLDTVWGGSVVNLLRQYSCNSCTSRTVQKMGGHLADSPYPDKPFCLSFLYDPKGTIILLQNLTVTQDNHLIL